MRVSRLFVCLKGKCLLIEVFVSFVMYIVFSAYLRRLEGRDSFYTTSDLESSDSENCSVSIASSRRKRFGS